MDGGAGCRVERVADGDQAMAGFALAAPDAVILDLAQPGVDGLQLASRPRGMSGVPSLLLSPRSDVHVASRACAGADD